MDSRDPPHLVLAGLSVVIAVQIGGFALIWSKNAPPPEYVYLPATTDKTTADSPVNTPIVVVSPPDEKALRQIIQAVLEQELAPYARQLVAAPEASKKMVPAGPPSVKENSPENIQALNAASNIVQGAMARGAWTNEDNMALFSMASGLTPDQRYRIMDGIGGAINRQELKIEAPPPAL
jgi:hypothetical protein